MLALKIILFKIAIAATSGWIMLELV